MSGLSVLVVAEFDDAGHAHAAQRCRALERLGCHVDAFDLREKPGLLSRFTGKDLRARLQKAAEASKADVVLVIGGPEIDADMVRHLKGATRARWANWFPDDMRTAEDVAKRAPAYDRVFVAGSDVAARVLAATGARVEVIPLGADPSIYRPLRSRDLYRANVVFAGSATARREALLAGLVEFGLAVWGEGWRRTSLKDYCRGEVPNTEEYVRAYGGASVAVNIHHTARDANGAEASVNQRLFEVAAIGVPQIVDDRGDLRQHLEPGRDLMVFHDADELKMLVAAALQDLPTADLTGASARKQVLARHTYMHRMKQVLEGVKAS
ncbi:MAG: glycosyltransferase [Gemmatimonadales bacterium]|nr:glycosyltransferase [Gemmatimonadales bacterium]